MVIFPKSQSLSFLVSKAVGSSSLLCLTSIMFIALAFMALSAKYPDHSQRTGTLCQRKSILSAILSRWPLMKPFSLTDSQLKDTFLKCIENVNGLLESAEILLLNGRTQQYALGMYMYAIEEYGKALLLKHCFTGRGTQYPVPRWIFGRGRPPTGKNAHDEKLAAGLDNLPPICTKLSRTLYIAYNRDSKIRTFVLRQDGPVDASMAVGPEHLEFSKIL